MNKLLTLLGQKKYDLLKAAMGADFDAFEKQFEDDEIKEADVTAKLDELGIKDEVEDVTTDTTDKTDATETDATETDATETDPVGGEADTTETVDETKEPDISAVLADGWLVDGKVDLEKILYEPLRGFVAGLQDIAVKADWEAKYKIAVLSEALKQGMYDMDDANRFISPDTLSTDDDGNVIGVKEAFDKLRAEKPHLFKPVAAGAKSPVDNGFNPVDKKVTGRPRSYAEAVEQTRALQVQ